MNMMNSYMCIMAIYLEKLIMLRKQVMEMKNYLASPSVA